MYSNLSAPYVVPFLQPAEEKPHSSFLFPSRFLIIGGDGDDGMRLWLLLIEHFLYTYICLCKYILYIKLCYISQLTIIICKLGFTVVTCATLEHVDDREGG